MARNLLVVDLSYQCYRASAAHAKLTSNGRFTGGLYGFFMTLGKMIREADVTELVIGRDMKPYRRSLEFPEYKAFRKANGNEELRALHRESMALLLGVFGELGIPIWGIDGFEYDDLVGHVVRKYRHRYDRIIAASNDSDLFQLLDAPNFYILSQDWADAWTRRRLMNKHGLTPDQFMLATALMGTHNDLPGIPKVGQGTAFKAVLEPGKLRVLREQHAAIVERNLRLIKLPHREFPWEARIPKATAEFDARKLYRALGRYDIEVTMSMVSALERTLL